MSKYKLRLYVTGQTPQGERALTNLRNLCEQELADAYELEVIDVIEQPQSADAARVIATPTLIRTLPPPLRRVIGDLSDRERVLIGLDLHPLDEDEDA